MGAGHLSKAQIFLESAAAWGTRVITTGTQIEFDDLGTNLDSPPIESRALYAGLSARALYQMGIKVAGSIAMEARYEGLAKIVAAMMGQLGTFTLTSVAVQTAVYHAGYTAQLGLPSLSLEVDEAGIYASGGDCSVVTGIVIPRARFTVNAGQGEDAMLRMALDILAKDKTPQTTAQYTAGVPAASQTPVFFFESEDANFSDGSGDAVAGVNVTGIEIEIVNALTDNRFHIAPVSKNIKQPLRSNRVQVFWTIKKEFTSQALYLAQRNFTDGALKAKFLSGTNIPSSSPATPYSIMFNTTKAKVVSEEHRENTFGIVEQTVRWQAYHDTAGSPANGPLIVTLGQSKASEAVLGA